MNGRWILMYLPLFAFGLVGLAGCGDDDDDVLPPVGVVMEPDAGPGSMDAGTGGPDAGQGSPDAGTGSMDGGTPGPDAGGEGEDAERFVGNFPGAAVSLWPPYSVAKIERTDSNTLPVIEPDDEVISERYYFWDYWPLRNQDGSITVIDGEVMIIGLSAPRAGNIPGERHGLAAWRYFVSSDEGWSYGGPVFPEGTPVGDRQWAGDAVYDPETSRVSFYYTALGELEPLPDEDESPTGAADGYEDAKRTGPTIVRQQIVETSAQLVTTGTVPQFAAFGPHRVILDADGEFYATAELARENNSLYVFRDPWYFEDPESDYRFLLFSASIGFQTGPKSGAVGMAVFDESQSRWRAISPIIAAIETNSQLERPHIVYRDGRYFLFFSSHEFTFGGEDPGPEGLYGFYADRVRGRYVPLNEGGLVLANPEEAPLQTYSYTVLPGGLVSSFINYFNLGEVTLEQISEQTREWQRERFGGTPAEPYFLDIGDRGTMLEGTMPVGMLPQGVERLAEALRGGS